VFIVQARSAENLL